LETFLISGRYSSTTLEIASSDSDVALSPSYLGEERRRRRESLSIMVSLFVGLFVVDKHTNKSTQSNQLNHVLATPLATDAIKGHGTVGEVDHGTGGGATETVGGCRGKGRGGSDKEGKEGGGKGLHAS
jgi:hypothetical protein